MHIICFYHIIDKNYEMKKMYIVLKFITFFISYHGVIIKHLSYHNTEFFQVKRHDFPLLNLLITYPNTTRMTDNNKALTELRTQVNNNVKETLWCIVYKPKYEFVQFTNYICQKA